MISINYYLIFSDEKHFHISIASLNYFRLKLQYMQTIIFLIETFETIICERK